MAGFQQLNRQTSLPHSAIQPLRQRAGLEPELGHRVIEIAGSSSKSIEDAIDTAVARASKTLRNLRWFEVKDMRGHLDDGKVSHYQVTLKVGFTID